MDYRIKSPVTVSNRTLTLAGFRNLNQGTRDVNEARTLEAEAEAEARTLDAKAEAKKFWPSKFNKF